MTLVLLVLLVRHLLDLHPLGAGEDRRDRELLDRQAEELRLGEVVPDQRGPVTAKAGRVPASAQGLLELRLGETGDDMTGYVAHVPHYLAQFDYPQAAQSLLEGVEDSTGLSFDLDGLKVAAEEKQREITAYLDDNPDVATVVAGLEQQYDALARGHEDGGLPLAEERSLPTAEELGDEFERFLAGLDSDED